MQTDHSGCDGMDPCSECLRGPEPVASANATEADILTRATDANEPFGVIESYVGDGRFIIFTNDGKRCEAQVLNKPGRVDYWGGVYTAEAIDGAAATMIGRKVFVRTTIA